MPTNSAKITIGKADVAISAYVVAGGAGTFVDIGHSKGPVTIEPVIQEYKVRSEQAMGTIRSVPIEAGYRIKFTILETDLEKMRQFLSQPAANLVTSGTTPSPAKIAAARRGRSSPTSASSSASSGSTCR